MTDLLAHGKTLWNVEGGPQGRKASPLTLHGIARARAVAGLLHDLLEAPSPATFLASLLARTWRRAVIVSQALGLDHRAIRFELRHAEQPFGLWEALAWQQIEALFPDLWAWRQADRWTFQVPAGKSYAPLALRVRDGCGQQPAWARLAVVGHGLAGRGLRGLYADLPEEEAIDMLELQGWLHRLAAGTSATVEAQTVVPG
jgi:probable phosphoglycerate mutase